MYATTNFRTKTALKKAVKDWRVRRHLATCGPMLTLGAVLSSHPSKLAPVECYQPGPFGPAVADGKHACEGPHYPEVHRWYAQVVVKDGIIVSVK